MFSKPTFVSTSSDILEAEYLQSRTWLRWVRCALSVLLLASALAVVGASGHTLQEYKHTIYLNKLFPFQVWPWNMDDRGTRALLGAGVIIALGSLAELAVGLIPSPRSRVNLQNMLAAAVGVSGIIVATFAIAYGFVLEAGENPTLKTYSCKWGNSTKGASPNFSRVCAESRFSLYMMVFMLAFELGMLGLGIYGMLMEKKMAGLRGLVERKSVSSQDQVETVG